MTELYILRHGIAVARGTPDIPDDQRPLIPKGRKRLRQVGRGLRRLGIEPDRIISSPLPRAWETAEIVADALGLTERLEASEALHADHDAASIAAWLLHRAEPRLMIVGHNPSLSDLLGLLVTGSADVPLCELKKGGVAALSSREAGKFAIDWIATPQILRRVADA